MRIHPFMLFMQIYSINELFSAFLNLKTLKNILEIEEISFYRKFSLKALPKKSRFRVYDMPLFSESLFLI